MKTESAMIEANNISAEAACDCCKCTPVCNCSSGCDFCKCSNCGCD